jgi:hypothetical protein
VYEHEYGYCQPSPCPCVLANTCWSAVVWKWVVDTSGEVVTGHALHIPLPEGRFTPPDHMPLEILTMDDPVDTSAAGTPPPPSNPTAEAPWRPHSTSGYHRSQCVPFAWLRAAQNPHNWNGTRWTLAGAVSESVLRLGADPTQCHPRAGATAASTHTSRPVFNLLRLAYSHPGLHHPIDGNVPAGPSLSSE